MKKYICLIICLLMAGCSSLKPVSSYDNAEEYLGYLRKAQGDVDLLEGYINEAEGGYQINFYNGNEDVLCLGKVRLLNQENKKICTYTTGLFGAGKFSFSSDVVEEEPVRFIFEKVQFYQFDYPDAKAEYSVVYDYNDEYEWNNILLEEYCTIENVSAASQYQYAYNVVTDGYYSLYYFYDENVEFYYDEEYDGNYPSILSAVYGAYFDYDDKKIEIYEGKGDIWESIEIIEMK